MASKRITITLPADLIIELDAAAAADFTKRSAFIKEAIILKIQLDSVIESEITDTESMHRLVTRHHMARMIGRRTRQIGPLSLADSQD